MRGDRLHLFEVRSQGVQLVGRRTITLIELLAKLILHLHTRLTLVGERLAETFLQLFHARLHLLERAHALDQFRRRLARRIFERRQAMVKRGREFIQL